MPRTDRESSLIALSAENSRRKHSRHPITHICMLLISNMIISKRSLPPGGGGLGWGGYSGEDERNFERFISILNLLRDFTPPTPALPRQGGGGFVGNRVSRPAAGFSAPSTPP